MDGITAVDLTPLLRASLEFCTCNHLRAVHKKGEDRTGCYSCACTVFSPRLRLVEDAAGETVAKIRTDDVGITAQQLQILKYVWAGLRLTEGAVTAPNGRLVCKVHRDTLAAMLRLHLVAPTGDRYTLTDAGRARVLVKERVRDFVNDLSNHPTT